mgnify:FL=1
MIPAGSFRNDILDYSHRKFNSEPIYPWTLLPEYAVLRHEGSLKWFALFMNVDGQRLGLIPGCIYDVIDLRCYESEVSSLLEKEGFIPAYHMSKKNWVTILLDGTVKLEKIITLLDRSFEITKEGKDYNNVNSVFSNNGAVIKNNNYDLSNDYSVVKSNDYNLSNDYSVVKSNDYDLSNDFNLSNNDTSDYRNKFDLSNGASASITFTNPYQDKPLSFGGRRHEENLPPRIREMKKLFNVFDTRPNADSYYFYKQGKLMEDYEEVYDYHGRFTRYYPTYRVMNNDQLRGYFDFRRRFRGGDNDTAIVSFVYVYLYELLCNIGISDPVDGFNMLLHVDDIFGRNYVSMHENIRSWLLDYVVYYNLPSSYLNNLYEKGIDDSLSVLISYENLILENDNVQLSEDDIHVIFEAIDTLSSYSLKKSPFYKKNPKDMEIIVVRAYKSISLFYQSHNKPCFLERCFGKKNIYPYHMFRKAIFYDHIHYENYEYVCSNARIFRCKDGHWTIESFYKLDTKSSDLGAVCREIDRICRIKYSFGHPLMPKMNLPLISNSITDVIDSYIKEKKEAAKPKIDIDFTKLSGIRRDAAYTSSQLITDDEMYDEETGKGISEEQESENEIDKKEVDVTKIDVNEFYKTEINKNEFYEKEVNRNEFYESEIDRKEIDRKEIVDKIEYEEEKGDYVMAKKTATGNLPSILLSEHQINIMKLLFEDGDINAYVHQNQLMLSVEIDAINEALYDIIGDTVIEFEDNKPSFVEDYLDEIIHLGLI